MPVLRNPRHERFVHELVKGQPASTAYRLAGYKAHGGHGNRLRQQPAIVQRYDELIAAAAEQTGVTAARIMDELAAIAFANPLDFFTLDASGKPRIDLSRVTPAQTGAIEVLIDKNDQNRTRVRFKVADKLRALVALARIMGLFREPVGPPEPQAEPISDVEAAQLMASLLRNTGRGVKQDEPSPEQDDQTLQ